MSRLCRAPDTRKGRTPHMGSPPQTSTRPGSAVKTSRRPCTLWANKPASSISPADTKPVRPASTSTLPETAPRACPPAEPGRRLDGQRPLESLADAATPVLLLTPPTGRTVTAAVAAAGRVPSSAISADDALTSRWARRTEPSRLYAIRGVSAPVILSRDQPNWAAATYLLRRRNSRRPYGGGYRFPNAAPGTGESSWECVWNNECKPR